jgi:hypothetical protein
MSKKEKILFALLALACVTASITSLVLVFGG